MSVGCKCKSEVAEPLRAIAGLHLRAQKLAHDLLAAFAFAKSFDDRVEGARLDHLAQRELDSKGCQIVFERDQFFSAWRLMDAVHDHRLCRFERAGGGDIGSNHELTSRWASTPSRAAIELIALFRRA